LAVFLSCFVCGCIPAGLPERFGAFSIKQGMEPVADPRRRAAVDTAAAENAFSRPLLVFTAESRAGAGEKILGCQYLLGIFPFTRLYLQHGVNHLLRETAVDAAISSGLTAALLGAGSAEKTAGLPQLGFKSELDSLSLNAFDLLFFRYLKADGQIRLKAENSSVSNRMTSETVSEIAGSEFRSYGHLPALSRLLEQSVDRSLSHHLVNSKISTSSPSSSGLDPVFILPPRISSSSSVELSRRFGEAYGFSGSAAFSVGQIERVLQIGLASGAERAGLVSAQLVYMPSSGARLRRSVRMPDRGWLLSADVKAVRVAESAAAARPLGGTDRGAAIDLEMSLYSFQAGKLQLAYSKPVRIYRILDDDADGAWIVTVENGAADAASKFFGGEDQIAGIKSVPESDSLSSADSREVYEEQIGGAN
jgi:hypothetical protein